MSIESDHLDVQLRCAKTGEQVPVRVKLDVRDVERGQTVRIGDPFEVDWDTVEGGGYWRLRAPTKDEAIRIVADYECSACGAAYSWVEVVVEHGTIHSAEPVRLDRATIERVHAIDGRIAELYEDALGAEPPDMPDAERLAYLRANPPPQFG